MKPDRPGSLVRRRAALAAAGLAFAALAVPAHAIVGGSPTTAFLAVGVGVQVTADWVVTAQHVALNRGDSYLNGYGARTVLQRYDAPGSGDFPANDLSLLRLAPAATAVPSLAVSTDRFSDGNFPALAVTITSPNNSGAARGFGFSSVNSYATALDPDDDGPHGPVTVNYLLNADATVHVEGGDSGGGLFLGRVTDSVTPLLGLNSALLTDDNDAAVGSGFVLIAAYRSWIDMTMTADTADNQLLRWVSAVPEPGALALWTLGLVALASRAATARRRVG